MWFGKCGLVGHGTVWVGADRCLSCLVRCYLIKHGWAWSRLVYVGVVRFGRAGCGEI